MTSSSSAIAGRVHVTRRHGVPGAAGQQHPLARGRRQLRRQHRHPQHVEAEGFDHLRRVPAVGGELGQHLVGDLELTDARQQDGGMVAHDSGDARRSRDAHLARLQEIGERRVVLPQLELAQALQARAHRHAPAGGAALRRTRPSPRRIDRARRAASPRTTVLHPNPAERRPPCDRASGPRRAGPRSRAMAARFARSSDGAGCGAGCASCNASRRDGDVTLAGAAAMGVDSASQPASAIEPAVARTVRRATGLLRERTARGPSRSLPSPRR